MKSLSSKQNAVNDFFCILSIKCKTKGKSFRFRNLSFCATQARMKGTKFFYWLLDAFSQHDYSFTPWIQCHCVPSSMKQIHTSAKAQGVNWVSRMQKPPSLSQLQTKASPVLTHMRARQHRLERASTNWDRWPRLRPSVSCRSIQWVLKTSSEMPGCALHVFPHQNKYEC